MFSAWPDVVAMVVSVVAVWLTLPGSVSATHTQIVDYHVHKCLRKGFCLGQMITFSLCLCQLKLCDEGQGE